MKKAELQTCIACDCDLLSTHTSSFQKISLQQQIVDLRAVNLQAKIDGLVDNLEQLDVTVEIGDPTILLMCDQCSIAEKFTLLDLAMRAMERSEQELNDEEV